jgi:DNA-binding transcriptional MerR regulator
MHSVEEMCRAGCTSRRGIRFWEDEGLLGKVERSNGGTRRYTPEQLDRARIIAAAQFGGWKLEEIKAMVASYDAEVYEALLTRLSNQAMAAARLGEMLPNPGAITPAVEYDL